MKISVLARPTPEGASRVSVFLVNDTQFESEFPSTADYVFQPEIRVRCVDGSRLLPVRDAGRTTDDETARLQIQYADRPVLGRGHMAAATWRAIDPESTPPVGVDPCDEPPFRWLDGESLWGDAVVAEFSPPDVRTTYLPMMAVNAPAYDWPDSTGPELDPVRLSATSQREEMERALRPLVTGYSAWVEHLEATANDPVSAAIMADCRMVADRLKDGVEFLTSDDDPDVRIAFCYANRAMALQSEWALRQAGVTGHHSWRPFQLAYLVLTIPSIADPGRDDRDICDLLWFPTGGGKTEAYLGLAAFTIALRRLRAARRGEQGDGTTVLSRYTLRLLTIQQFRRALALITACELLRVEDGGWWPDRGPERPTAPWGSERISIGLWAGQQVTPNNLYSYNYKNAAGQLVYVPGALDLLSSAADAKKADGEPAQVLTCPACGGTTAVPDTGWDEGESHTLHLVWGGAPASTFDHSGLQTDKFRVDALTVHPLPGGTYSVWSVALTTLDVVLPEDVDRITDMLQARFGADAWPTAARASRPAYFLREDDNDKSYDFEVICPAPDCPLAGHEWTETLPAGPWPVEPSFALGDSVASRVPIPAWTVDEQLYRRCPTLVISTVDKFARLPFEPRAAALFGNVNTHHVRLGYFRQFVPPSEPNSQPGKTWKNEPRSGRNVAVSQRRSPELILQDELHLIEGPLGTMTGLYETAVEMLASGNPGNGDVRPKYIASTATARDAGPQVASLFNRRVQVFPAPGLRADESFFATGEVPHPLDERNAGRLYLGLAAPGRGPQTPLVRTWASLLQCGENQRRAGAPPGELDPFWTVVGYFNAIRELAGTASLYRQDIPQRLANKGKDARSVGAEPLELSSRADSHELPALLTRLSRGLPAVESPVDTVLTTSMFGTGVDVPRLGLMVVAGQPKTTSAYIQATGRVGRSSGGLVITFLRASRPRDLNHYEFFTGYHLALYRHVEPVTVHPFAPGARERGLGPLMVALLRNARFLLTAPPLEVTEMWRREQRLKAGWRSGADLMASKRALPEVRALEELLEARAQSQPPQRRPPRGRVAQEAASELDRWEGVAALHAPSLRYVEYTASQPASVPVVLGDPAHASAALDQAYENAPQSLREVESTTTFRGR